jgi:hypothetical protein
VRERYGRVYWHRRSAFQPCIVMFMTATIRPISHTVCSRCLHMLLHCSALRLHGSSVASSGAEHAVFTDY